MLSFLREQSCEDLSMQKASGAAGRLIADSTGEVQEQGYLTVAAKDKNVRRSTILLAVLFGVGLLCLWFMIKKSAPATTAAAAMVNTEETQIELAIARLTGVRSEMFNRLERIVKKFYEFSDMQQVEVDELAKNPFKLDKFWDDLEEASNNEESAVAPLVEDLELLAICQAGEDNYCMIGDKILHEGDLIGDFMVRQISDSFVKLERRGTERGLESSNKEYLRTQIILKLSE